jgi:large repetitive protein
LQAPSNGFSTTNKKPAFDWNDPVGATGFTIQISKNAGFISLVGTYNVATSTYTPTTNLPLGTLYWRVKANGPNGPSGWSAPWTLIEN